MNRNYYLLFCFAAVLLQLSLTAQDNTKKSAGKQVDVSSETADKLYGKKIQQQTFTNNHIDRLPAADVKKTIKRTVINRRKHPR